MGRFTDMDEVCDGGVSATPCSYSTNAVQDEYRLPEGMQRIGYDADTQRYTFRDAEGKLFESAPGSRYGELRPAGEIDQATEYTPPADIEERNAVVERDHRTAVRTMLPFALLVFVLLLLLFRATNSGFWGAGLDKTRADDGAAQILDCHDGSRQIQVEKGDTCWDIAQGRGLGVDELLVLKGNEEVDCDRLRIGQGMCVPVGAADV
jgi:hypothetical protein